MLTGYLILPPPLWRRSASSVGLATIPEHQAMGGLMRRAEFARPKPRRTRSWLCHPRRVGSCRLEHAGGVMPDSRRRMVPPEHRAAAGGFLALALRPWRARNWILECQWS